MAACAAQSGFMGGYSKAEQDVALDRILEDMDQLENRGKVSRAHAEVHAGPCRLRLVGTSAGAGMAESKQRSQPLVAHAV